MLSKGGNPVPPEAMAVAAAIQLFLGFFAYYSQIKMNDFVGYRTPRAMVNEETWLYANKTFGKYSIIAGTINVLFGLWGRTVSYGHHQQAILWIGNLLLLVAGVGISIYLTEKKLFEKFGD